MRSTSIRAMIAFSFSVISFLAIGSSVVSAQTQITDFPTRPSPFIPGFTGVPSPTPTVPGTTMIQAPTGDTSGGGFSDYVNGLPTVFTLPDGRRIDISIPENTIAENSTLLRLVPKVPKAYEQVTLTVENFSTDLEEDRITWTVNGKIVQDRIGGDTITTTMGKVGETLVIRVVIDSRKLGKRLMKETRITAGDVAILWEANTYIPPFYKGKPLPSYKSTIKLVPLPTMIVGGRSIAPENLLYTWKRNYRVTKDISGYGKRYATFEAGGGVQQERLQLTVTHPESDAATERSVLISITQPKVLLYEGSPLQGIRYEKALGKTVSLGNVETTIRGEPYFFSNEELLTGTSPLVWKQNGKTIPSLYRTVVLKKPEESGTSRIDATIENPTRVLQSARGSVSISYSNEQ